jgi:cytochrome b
MPPLTPVLAGIFCKLGFSTWTSMKLVSCIFFLAGIYWVYRLACLRLPPEKAQWCSLLFVACPRLLRYGMAGQLDAAKIFLLLFVFERTISFMQSKRWMLLFHATIGAALLALCRNEGVGYLPLMGLFLLFSEWLFPTKEISVWKKLMKGVGQNVFVLSICLLIWSPWMAYEYRISGYPVLGTKHIAVLKRVIPFLNIKEIPSVSEYLVKFKRAGNSYNKELKSSKEGTTSLSSTKDTNLDKNKYLSKPFKKIFEKPERYSVHSKIVGTIKGIYMPYFFVVILGIYSLLISKNWTRIDFLFAAVFIFNILLQWFIVINVLKRLVAPTIPFYFPWFIFGFDLVKSYFAEKVAFENIKKARNVGYSILSLVVLIMIWDGMSHTRKSLRGKYDTVKQIALWIKENREQLDFNEAEPLKLTKDIIGYHNGRQPVIATFKPQIATWAEADLLLIRSKPPKTHLEIVNHFIKHNLDLLILDSKFRKAFPGFNPNTPHFKLISNEWEDKGFLIYSFSPLTIVE